MLAVFQLQEHRDRAHDNKVLLCRGACLVEGQVEPPEDVGNGHSLLIQGKLLSNAVPGGEEGGRERNRRKGKSNKPNYSL